MFTRIFPALTPATRALILINVGVFLLQQLFGSNFDRLFALWPLGSGLFHPWQVLSYAFLHGSIMHIFVNMFALFMFGGALESLWGPRRFIFYYLVCSLTAAFTQLAVATPEPTVGASGGIFGVLLGFAWFFPQQRILLLFPPIPMPAWLFVTGYALLELYFGVSGRDQGVAHFAHLGGLVGGALCILYWRARRRFGH
jgi:membrane associated rhomboid family serine protease